MSGGNTQLPREKLLSVHHCPEGKGFPSHTHPLMGEVNADRKCQGQTVPCAQTGSFICTVPGCFLAPCPCLQPWELTLLCYR